MNNLKLQSQWILWNHGLNDKSWSNDSYKNIFVYQNLYDLKIYFDNPTTLAKTFNLRGVPTTILINKDGFEFARIVGSIDFNNQNLSKSGVYAVKSGKPLARSIRGFIQKKYLFLINLIKIIYL